MQWFKFNIVREQRAVGTAEALWEAVTTGIGGWLWPQEIEPREGGLVDEGAGIVEAWEPPRHLATIAEGPDGWFNRLDFDLRAGDAGHRVLRYTHAGVVPEEDAHVVADIERHTEFYLDAFRRYVEHFAGLPVTYTHVEARGSGDQPEAFEVLLTRLGLGDEDIPGERLHVDLPDGRTEVVIDYHDHYFLGLRTDTALYRFFGRNRFGASVGLAIHDFSGTLDAADLTRAGQEFLDRLYGA